MGISIYIWEILQKILNDNECNLSDFSFKPGKEVNPYLELQSRVLNKLSLDEKDIEINPFYRIAQIINSSNFFNALYHEENENCEWAQELLDLVCFFIGYIDLQSGYTPNDYLKTQLKELIDSGNFGDQAKQWFEEVSEENQSKLLYHIVNLKKLGIANLEKFQLVLSSFFTNSRVYLRNGKLNEIIIYLGVEKSDKVDNLLILLKHFFLPISYTINETICYENHFGIIGVAETMKIGQITIID